MRFELTTLTLARLCSTPELRPHSVGRVIVRGGDGRKEKNGWAEMRKAAPRGGLLPLVRLERAMRFELTTLTLARLCSTPELRPRRLDEG